MMNTQIEAPSGMYGLAAEPWSRGEIYAVAANWAEASCPVMVWGSTEDGWSKMGRQVADFCHSPREALASLLNQAMLASGIDEPEQDDVDGLLDDAIEIND